MKKLILVLLLLAPCALHAQRTASNPLGGNLTVQDAGTCSTSGSFLWQVLPSNAATTTVNLAGTFSGTVTVRESNNGGGSWTTAGTQTTAGTSSYSTNGFTDICADVTTYASGTISVTISTGLNTGPVGPAGPAGGAAANSIPVTSGLMAEYRMLSSETCGSIVDYSGNGNTSTGTIGTAPTIIAGSGGCTFTGNGAIKLPAALNTAQTIQVYASFQPGPLSAGFYCPVLGSGSTSTSGVGIVITNNTSVAEAPSGGANVGTATDTVGTFANNFSGGGVLYTSAFNPFTGVGSLSLAMNGGGDSLYVNGVPMVAAQTGTTLNKQTSDFYQLGGAAAGSGNTSLTYYNGNIYYAVFYNRALTTTEIYQNHVFMQNALLSRGVVPSSVRTDNGDMLTGYGDSLTAGQGGAPSPYTGAIVLNGTWNISNKGRSGLNSTQLVSNLPAIVAPTYGTASRNAAIIWTGANDTVAATVFANLVGMANSLRTQGWRVLVSSVIDHATGIAAYKNTVNGSIRQNWSTFADGLIDLAAEPLLGADAAATNTTYFSTNLHPTTTANINLITPMMQRAVNRLFGNQDFSSATTYVAAAAAAVATTAGSESTNTVTITFGATPANCQVGNIITITGATPAGYNGDWFIRTRNATQVTYFATTASMGAISVQGTGVCPQQQDADTFSVLNFGAGNFTLQSCVGYTGQNIYIQNINAVASTLVPFGSETITGGGATPTTLTNATTAILQSELVSAAAGGCNWRRLQ